MLSLLLIIKTSSTPCKKLRDKKKKKENKKKEINFYVEKKLKKKHQHINKLDRILNKIKMLVVTFCSFCQDFLAVKNQEDLVICLIY